MIVRKPCLIPLIFYLIFTPFAVLARRAPAGSAWPIPRRTLLRATGWQDGVLRVIVALEIARASRAAGGPAISVLSFQDEDGRIGGTTGSAVWPCLLTLAEAGVVKDSDGVPLSEARSLLGDRVGSAVDPSIPVRATARWSGH